jgi:hypothetical protein
MTVRHSLQKTLQVRLRLRYNALDFLDVGLYHHIHKVCSSYNLYNNTISCSNLRTLYSFDISVMESELCGNPVSPKELKQQIDGLLINIPTSNLEPQSSFARQKTTSLVLTWCRLHSVYLYHLPCRGTVHLNCGPIADYPGTWLFSSVRSIEYREEFNLGSHCTISYKLIM